MFLYTLFYYDRPMLEAWLSHYLQFDCIEEIIIQNQNWSDEDSLYLLETVADYIDKFNKKIVVLPSNFIHIEGEKRSQFASYGQSKIRNRVMQFLKGKTFIASSMDEIFYGKNYQDTGRELARFEQVAEERVKKGKSTVGFVPLYCVWKKGIYPCNGIPIKQLESPTWRHRLFRFVRPFRRKPSLVHDATYQILVRNRWRNVTPSSHLKTKQGIAKFDGVALDLKLYHYHTLVHPSFESVEYIIPKINTIKNTEQHPQLYLTRLLGAKVPKKAREPPLTPLQKARLKHWRDKINRNVKEDRAWYHGVPYKWWYGLTPSLFLIALRKHLDPKKEPLWF